MERDKVKFYGGPKHGHVMAINDVRRISFPYAPPRRINWSNLDITPAEITFSEVSYYIQIWAENKWKPKRYKKIKIAIYEDSKILSKDKYEMERDFDKVPWTVEKADSFLYDFEQWFSEACFRITGELRWEGEKIK